MPEVVRILHLHAAAPDFQTARCATALRREIGRDFNIIHQTIGRGGTYRNPAAAAIALRAAQRYDLIHVWDGASLAAAAVGASAPLLYSPMQPLRQRQIGWARAIADYRQVQIVCPTGTQRRMCVERGVALERCHLIRPGVEFARVRRRRNPELRAALGFGTDDRVLLAVGESTESAGHDLGVWSASMLHILDERYKVLLWGRGAGARRAVELGTRLGRPGLARSAEATLGCAIDCEELCGAADAALVTARGPVATLPIAICMAAGLPIVSAASYTVGELLEDRHSALLVPKPAPRRIARRVLDLYEDASLQWSIADTARTEAFEYFALTRFLEQYRAVYRQIAHGEPVEVPERAPGAGLRFHGRA